MPDPRQLASMLQNEPRLGALAGLCDLFSEPERILAVRALGASELATLYRCAENPEGRAELSFLVPGDAPPGATVVWEGKNSLPAFSRFTKRFTRAAGAMVGRNTSAMEWLVGPGYFTVEIRPGHPAELLIDYTREPSAPPLGWPKVKKNRAGASYFVFRNLNDFLRPVGKHVAVGAAYDAKSGRFRGQYFALARGATLTLAP